MTIVFVTRTDLILNKEEAKKVLSKSLILKLKIDKQNILFLFTIHSFQFCFCHTHEFNLNVPPIFTFNQEYY